MHGSFLIQNGDRHYNQIEYKPYKENNIHPVVMLLDPITPAPTARPGTSYSSLNSNPNGFSRWTWLFPEQIGPLSAVFISIDLKKKMAWDNSPACTLH